MKMITNGIFDNFDLTTNWASLAFCLIKATLLSESCKILESSKPCPESDKDLELFLKCIKVPVGW